MQGFHRMEGIILSQNVLTYYIFSFLFFRCCFHNIVATVRRQWLQQQQQLLVIFTLTQTTKTQKKEKTFFTWHCLAEALPRRVRVRVRVWKGDDSAGAGAAICIFQRRQNAIATAWQERKFESEFESIITRAFASHDE